MTTNISAGFKDRVVIDIENLPGWAKCTISGNDYVTHKGLTSMAHQHGIQSIVTKIVQWSDPDAVVIATATGERGTYTGIGDAKPSNVGDFIAGACLRMAETRAVNRALRLYLGIGMCSAEELENENPENPKGAAKGNGKRTRKPAQAAANDGPPCPECGGPMWDNRDDDKKAIYRCKDKENCKNSGGYPGAIWRNDPVWGIDPPGSKMREQMAGGMADEVFEPDVTREYELEANDDQEFRQGVALDELNDNDVLF